MATRREAGVKAASGFSPNESEQHIQWWAEKDLNLRRLTPAGLQPAPFGHSGIDP